MSAENINASFIFFKYQKSHCHTFKQLKSLYRDAEWIDPLKFLYNNEPLNFNGLNLEIDNHSLILSKGCTKIKYNLDQKSVCNLLNEMQLGLVELNNSFEPYEKVTELEIGGFRQLLLISKYCQITKYQSTDPERSYFKSANEIAYWEKLRFNSMWEEFQTTYSQEFKNYQETGVASDSLKFVIACRYFFGNLVSRPIFLKDLKLDTIDEKLGYSAPIGTSIEVARFIKNQNHSKVLEVFTGRGNLTLILSLIGLKEIYTIDIDNHNDISASWHAAILNYCETVPEALRADITVPVFITGDVFNFKDIIVDCSIMDPPYGRASEGIASPGNEAQALLFFFKVIDLLKNFNSKQVYSVIPSEWSKIMNQVNDIEFILKSSVYFKRKPLKLDAFLNIIHENQNYLHSLKELINNLEITCHINRTSIINVLGKDLDIVEIKPN
ncbi:MAG: hypothetical protein JHC93_02295 [Parachlamydiales bacterium]|nr:hypothetical protein [Parachlamydiales bacterium]